MSTVQEVKRAEEALAYFRRTVGEDSPWVPGILFSTNPGLDLYITAALERWVEDTKNRLPIETGQITDAELNEIANGGWWEASKNGSDAG